MSNTEGSNKDLAIKVSVMSIVINIILSILKLVAGIVSHSSAMISDAVHSASDVISTIVVIVGVNISSKQADKEHPYGHERLESISALLLSIILSATGFMIGFSGIKNIIDGTVQEITGGIALGSAIVSIVVKEVQYQYTKNVANKVGSDSLMADAWHHRSDALSSIGSSIGIIGAMVGLPIMDNLASIVICIFIIRAGYEIMKEAINKLIDRSCDDKTIAQIETVIVSQEGVRGIDEFRTRLFGSKIYVDVTILIDGDTLLKDAHAISEKVHDNVESSFPNIKHCMIHIHPFIKIDN
ncbi:MAG: cation diffusion facilitator family transporter [Ruminococcus sp.]|nr:cation diffusion facilitator family transporter [Ruminococcus sp.]